MPHGYQLSFLFANLPFLICRILNADRPKLPHFPPLTGTTLCRAKGRPEKALWGEQPGRGGHKGRHEEREPGAQIHPAIDSRFDPWCPEINPQGNPFSQVLLQAGFGGDVYFYIFSL